jgi:hypothetical protein
VTDVSKPPSGRGLHLLAFVGVIGIAVLAFNLVRDPAKTATAPVATPAPPPAAAPITPAHSPTPSVSPITPPRLQFGVPETRVWMKGGWSVDEKIGDETYVWSDGPRSQLVLRFPADEDVRLDFSCQPYIYPGNRTQTVTVVLNGTTIQKVSLKTGLHPYTVVLPKSAIRASPNTLEFVYGYAERPQVVEKRSADTRQLGVAWHSIDLNPVKK